MAACERIFKLLDTAARDRHAPPIPRPATAPAASSSARLVHLPERLDAASSSSTHRRSHRPQDLAALADIEWILQRRLLHHRARRDRRHRRPHRRRQNHHHQPDDALLRRTARPDPRRWRRRARAGPHRAAPATSPSCCRTRSSSPAPSPTTSASASTCDHRRRTCERAADEVNVLRLHPHAARAASTSPCSERGNSPLHRPEAAHQLRPRPGPQSPHPHPRRSHLRVDTDTELRVRGALERMVTAAPASSSRTASPPSSAPTPSSSCTKASSARWAPTSNCSPIAASTGSSTSCSTRTRNWRPHPRIATLRSLSAPTESYARPAKRTGGTNRLHQASKKCVNGRPAIGILLTRHSRKGHRHADHPKLPVLR